MNLLTRRRKRFFMEKAMYLQGTDHFVDGKVLHDSASYNGYVWICGCGERFVDANDLREHIAARKAREEAVEQIREAHFDGRAGTY